MKNIGLLLLTFLFGSQITFAQNDAISNLFNEYADNDKEFTSVYISPKMFKMIATISGDKEANEIADISKDIKTLRILTSDKTPRAYYKKASLKLNKNNYEELMTVREKGQDIRFVTKSDGDIIKELVLLVGSDDSFVMLDFTGNIDLEKLSKLAGKLDIQGTDQLGKLEKK